MRILLVLIQVFLFGKAFGMPKCRVRLKYVYGSLHQYFAYLKVRGELFAKKREGN
jgi:hypothetical protein